MGIIKLISFLNSKTSGETLQFKIVKQFKTGVIINMEGGTFFIKAPQYRVTVDSNGEIGTVIGVENKTIGKVSLDKVPMVVDIPLHSLSIQELINTEL